MQKIEHITAAIISREGGYVNDPDDLGGPTKFGVTLATAQGHNLDKNGDGRVTAEDVKRLTTDDAAQIFIHSYFRKPKIDKLPKALHPTVFDLPECCLWMPMGLHGEIIIWRWAMPNRGCANMPEQGPAARAAGLFGPKNLSGQGFIYHLLIFKTGWRNGDNWKSFFDAVWQWAQCFKRNRRGVSPQC
jgi:hypothetical protein